jgi:hypothetical protein
MREALAVRIEEQDYLVPKVASAGRFESLVRWNITLPAEPSRNSPSRGWFSDVKESREYVSGWCDRKLSQNPTDGDARRLHRR